MKKTKHTTSHKKTILFATMKVLYLKYPQQKTIQALEDCEILQISRYGQNYYDFGEGGLIFSAPNQIFETPPANHEIEGCLLLIQPDFLLSYPLAKKITQYGFFSYAANETLHLSDFEKETILSIFKSLMRN